MSRPVMLVVDDDRQVLSALRRDLRGRYREGYSVLTASSGDEAIAAIREMKSKGEPLALVLSDQRMPGMSGVELLAASREIYPIARRVLLTAYSDIDAVIRGINQAHLDHYLSKPWDPPEERLYPVLDDLLDSWEAERRPETTGLRLVGNQWSARSHAMKDYLAGNLIPYRWLDIERDGEAGRLIAAAGVDPERLPVLFFEDGSWIANPEPLEIAERLGLSLSTEHDLYDVAIVGAGPAGLAAAVYASSEGLRTLLVERRAPGGQAGMSSRIENYLGFPRGVSGTELTRRALIQARRLGAEFIVPLEITGLRLEGGYKRLQAGAERELVAKAVLVVTGMTYRELDVPGVREHTGAGIYYGASAPEAQACYGGTVLVIGGGNSAGQCALHVARFAKKVMLVARRPALEETMSRYLTDQLKEVANIELCLSTVLSCVDGDGRVERAVLKSVDTGATSSVPVEAIFVMIGTRPHTEWLPEEVLRDPNGFVLAGRELAATEAFRRVWKESRDPLPLETSVPGVFAAGDVRAGAINRVASAVGEGALAVRLVHDYMALT